MKLNSTLLLLLASVTLGINACDKKDHEPQKNYSYGNLSKINFGKGRYRTPYEVSFEYDSLNKLIKTNYSSTYNTLTYQKNSITRRFSYGDYIVYKTDDNGRIVSDIKYPEKDSTHYEYDGEGYLINKKVYRYIYGSQIWQDLKYTYKNGNLVMAVTDYYDAPGIKYSGTDTLTFSYNNSLWYPEAIYLPHVPDLLTGKPSRNNISDIHVNAFILSPLLQYFYKDVHYEYTEIGKRLGKVTMDYTDHWGGQRDTINIDFSYQPKN